MSCKQAGFSQLVDEAEAGEITNTLWVEDAIKMIAFMLYHACMETLGFHPDWLAAGIESTVFYAAVTRYQAAHAGYAEAAFPAIFHG